MVSEEMKAAFKKFSQLLLLASAVLLLAAVAVRWRIGPIPLDRLRPPPSPVILDRHGQPLRFFLAPDDQWRFQSQLKDISPRLLRAVIACEDRWFYYHPGTNPLSLVRAFAQDLLAGHIVSGGSTLTMQVARMTERRPRTYRAKLAEIARALQLELTFSKKEILAFYFNLAPYGGNLQGVGAASWLYFGKPPSQLGWAEIALLVALPQSPEQRRPDLHPAQAKKARDRVLARFLNLRLITAEEYRRALLNPVPTAWASLPLIAPHLSQMLADRAGPSGRVLSTVDLNLQTLCEEKTRQHIARLKPRGISDAAVVVIENKSRSVRALVGSPDFFDVPGQGQVNAALAVRSPGSTLKPFLYARGLDRGLVSPELLLADVPANYAGYEPKNYDETYRGMVSMKDALIASLNIPAINLEARLGLDGTWSLLRQAEFRSISPDRSRYGLSIILGGCGVSLIELTNLYSTLAQQGLWQRYRLVESEPLAAPQRLFSAEAAFIVTDLLSQVKRPEMDNDLIPATNLPTIAWKTGTSYGRKDGWSIGYDRDWTIGVWVGNASGEGNPELVGAISAAPLLFEIFDALASSKNQKWFERPPEVWVRRVCALSGMIPGPNCPETKEEYFIHAVSPNRVCDFHQLYDIDDRTGYRLCSFCREGRAYASKLFIQWPHEVATWMQANHLRAEAIPPHLPACPHQGQTLAPKIVSPSPDDRFLLRPGIAPRDQQIALRASVDNRIKNIYWFLDGELFSKGPPAQTVFYLPVPGRHQLTCLDEEGNKSTLVFSVDSSE